MAGNKPTSSTARGGREPVFVTIGPVKYGFQASNRSDAFRTLLGHTNYTGQPGVVFGANSPKPNRATLIRTTGDVSSFCDPSKEDELKKAGWQIQRNSRRRGVGASAKTITVFVPMPGGYNYAWRMRKADFTQFGAILGIEQATGTTPNLVWGSSPKPPQATIRTETGQTQSSKIAPKAAVIDKAAGAGWSISGIDYDLVPEDAGA